MKDKEEIKWKMCYLADLKRKAINYVHMQENFVSCGKRYTL
jgi:hypothetical protein